MGGKRFEPNVPVEIDDPSVGAKLDGNAEFEQVTGADDLQNPVWSPPGPTGIGSGPGSGPYQTTSEVIDQDPNPDAGKPTEEELEEQRQAAEEAAADTEEKVQSTEEGPKRKASKKAAEPPPEI
jgi:hypothetical protein